MRKEGASGGRAKPGGTAGDSILSQQMMLGTGFLFGGGGEDDRADKTMARLRARELHRPTGAHGNLLTIIMNVERGLSL